MPYRFFWIALVFLAACSGTDRMAAPVIPVPQAVITQEAVYYATSRNKEEDGSFGIGRSPVLHFGKASISLPPGREPGEITYGGAKPDPLKHFAFAADQRFPDHSAFGKALRRSVTRLPADQREVVMFIHGFNSSYGDALFRMAQIKHDLEIPGAVIAYAWPSRAHPLAYEYDDDSALYARDGLEDLLMTVRAAGVEKLVLVAHSMGSFVLMETLRQIERVDPGWTGRSASGVILISPDLGVDVFRSQLTALQTVPDPFAIYVSRRDHVLRLSAALTGETERLGNIQSVESVADLPVSVVDVTDFSDARSGNHFVAVSSPALIALYNRSDRLDREFLRGRPDKDSSILNTQRIIVQNATEIIVERLDR